MINMFRAELYRLTKSRGFWFFWIASLAVSLITIAYKSPGGVSFGASFNYDPKLKMDIVQLGMNFTYYFLLIIPVYCLISAEFNEHTIKNTISSAISKKMYYVSKFIFCMVYSVLSYVVACYAFYFLNRVINGSKYSSSFGKFSEALFRQLPVIAGVVAVFIFIAFLFKRGAALNSVTIITPIVYTTVSLTLFGIKSTKSAAEHMLKYEVSTIFSSLAAGCTDSYRTRCYMAIAIISAASAVLGYLVFSKRELD